MRIVKERRVGEGKAEREERLAAALRENLRRRKAQARAAPPSSIDPDTPPRSP